MTERDDVLAAFDRLAQKLTPVKAWTRGTNARKGSSRNGRFVSPHDPAATSWCLLGALEALDSPHKVWLSLLKESPFEGISEFNDAPGRTQAEVLDLIARARARYEAEVPS